MKSNPFVEMPLFALCFVLLIFTIPFILIDMWDDRKKPKKMMFTFRP